MVINNKDTENGMELEATEESNEVGEGNHNSEEDTGFDILFEKRDNSTLEKKKGKKRSLHKENWLKNKAKKLRNSGEAYTSSSKSKRQMPKKKLKPPCRDSCKIKC
jgi:hypothetical protein